MMDVVILLVRIVLVGVFGLAGFAKLFDPDGTRGMLRNFGLPERSVAPAAVALPLAEVAVALFLLPLGTSWIAAVGGLLLMLAFSGGIAWNLSRGRTPDCNCFGQVHTSPIGPLTLVRNGVFVVLAAVLVFRGKDGQGSSATGWWGDLSGIERVLLLGNTAALAVVAALSWVVVHLLQQQGRLLLRLDAIEANPASGEQPGAQRQATTESGLAVGSVAPEFNLRTVDGELHSLADLRASDRPAILVFADPGCGPCNALLPEVSRWQREHADVVDIAIISRGAVDANRRKQEEHGLRNLLLQVDREIATAYNTMPTPGAVLVRRDGRIGERPALGAEAIRALVARTVTEPSTNGGSGSNGAATPQRLSQVGRPAPEVILPALDGSMFSLADFRDKQTLLTFWNPGCGYCNRMVNDLKAWLSDPPSGAPEVVLISSGTPEANASQGIPATTLLDQSFATGRAFGVSGTPSAVLVDVDGTIASPVAVGAPGIWSLVGGEKEARPHPHSG